MELTFLGTRGGIEACSRRHRRHSSLLIEHHDARIMIDCGADWLGRLSAIAPSAIVLTHAHPDHAAGLADGAPCPIYATEETLDLLTRFPLHELRRVPVQKSITIEGVSFQAFRVSHSICAPTVGYRVWTEEGCFFYVPDVAELQRTPFALRGSSLYIGDGASITRSMVRMKSGVLIGHAPIVTQLAWCKTGGVCRAIFTHCGSQIVRGDPRRLNAVIRRLGRENGVIARLACDGDRLCIPVEENGA